MFSVTTSLSKQATAAADRVAKENIFTVLDTHDIDSTVEKKSLGYFMNNCRQEINNIELMKKVSVEGTLERELFEWSIFSIITQRWVNILFHSYIYV